MDAARIAELTALGLYDPASPAAADRLALLELLAADAVPDAEMVAAERAGRLFALAGDRIVEARTTHSQLQAAQALGLDPADFARIWLAAGLPRVGSDVPDLSGADVADLAALSDVAVLLGIDAAVDVARVLGASMARVAEAESSAVRRAVESIDLDVSHSEVATALAWRATAELIPKVGRLLDVIHRRHLRLVRPYFESIAMRGRGSEATLGVGFVDLSGFTALSAATPLTALSKVVAVFEARASETVLDGGGRLVKFLGDAVMFTSADRDRTARIALDLVGDPVAAEAGIAARGGVAWGDVLVRDGDYFGSPVNLAARLVAMARPTTVLGSPEFAGLGGGMDSRTLEPQVVRGFDAPLRPVVISGGPQGRSADRQPSPG